MGSGLFRFLELDLFQNVMHQVVDLHTLLLHAVAVTDSNAAVRLAVKVIGDAVRRADLILPAIPLANGTGIVVIHHKVLGQAVVNLLRLVVQLLERGNTAALNGASAGCRCMTTRVSFFSASTTSSSYASQRKAKVTRSAPRDGSTT